MGRLQPWLAVLYCQWAGCENGQLHGYGCGHGCRKWKINFAAKLNDMHLFCFIHFDFFHYLHIIVYDNCCL